MVVATAVVGIAFGSLAGCSGADGPESPGTTPSADGAVDADRVRTGLAAVYVGDHATGSQREEGECFADALLGRLDSDDLVSAGILDTRGDVVTTLPVLDVDTATAWVDAQADCIDYVLASTRALTAQSKGKLDGERYLACLRGALEPEQIRDAQVAALSGGMESPAIAELTRAQSDCATESLPVD